MVRASIKKYFERCVTIINFRGYFLETDVRKYSNKMEYLRL